MKTELWSGWKFSKWMTACVQLFRPCVIYYQFTWNCLKSKFSSIMLCTAPPSLSSVIRSRASFMSAARWRTWERRGEEGRLVGKEGRGDEVAISKQALYMTATHVSVPVCSWEGILSLFLDGGRTPASHLDTVPPLPLYWLLAGSSSCWCTQNDPCWIMIWHSVVRLPVASFSGCGESLGMRLGYLCSTEATI